ncbi:hypothetical protein SAMN05421505_11872 [Sinosporangium album]|uniref:Excreted virulence factor EspC, type VII ESX diderm n=1 Tax=Sinosporangium album TaxID=504805 RepID=A0A1G8DJR8_9ACTN|nr:hypothetical protein [Sinosporangium album]SDH57709.1 hypothetical protein SAMN05421505_11872 [Sinosporangium album]
MTGYEIYSGTVERGGTYISGHGADYNASVMRLRQRGSGTRTFGGEGLFATITGAYNECLQVSLDAMTGIGRGIAETGEGLRTVSRNTRAAESANTDNFTSPAWR